MPAEQGAPRGLPRPVEAVLAGAGLVILAPLLALAGLAVTLTSPGPIFFRQERVGRDGRLFTLVKLRTMRWREKGAAITAAGDRRITPVGRLLRRTKLDELPELWNVLRGDMAFVGPRPEVPEYYVAAEALWRRVVVCRPGLTHPVTLRLRHEELLLEGVADREAFYREVLLPYKLRGYALYEKRRSWASDVLVICDTLIQLVIPGAAALPSREELTSGAGDLCDEP